MSFYVPVADGVVRATEHTVGPWAPTDQHAGLAHGGLFQRLHHAVAQHLEDWKLVAQLGGDGR